jgi:hypothetical protein
MCEKYLGSELLLRREVPAEQDRVCFADCILVTGRAKRGSGSSGLIRIKKRITDLAFFVRFAKVETGFGIVREMLGWFAGGKTISGGWVRDAKHEKSISINSPHFLRK